MKEASGELSMTAVAVVAIGAIAVVFTTLIWPSIKTSITRNTYCSQAYNCQKADKDTGLANCTYLDENNKPQPIKCAMSN